ncbi:hypothetical protein RHORCCE3_0992 [Rickettsia hoogstraalii str. RCCE3]|nr:hypothetical protein RHORCCE3_0992 [Rickettsia hoogstraalii str. RCCE3]
MSTQRKNTLKNLIKKKYVYDSLGGGNDTC